jgi:hypothetical protein
MAAKRKSDAPRPFTRQGLHRLECQDCPGYAYLTVACLESVGLPSCACGGRLMPERLELSILLGVDDGSRREEIERLALDKRMSQERSLGRRMSRAAIEEARLRGTINDMDASALEQIRAHEREAARVRRLAALGLGERVERVRGEEIRTRYVLPTPEILPF